jgi:hypothetical protein
MDIIENAPPPERAATDLVVGDIGSTDGTYNTDNTAVNIEVGQWYWVQDVDREWDDVAQAHVKVKSEWLGCVMNVGSNYLLLRSPSGRHSGYTTTRVHFDDFWTKLRFEPNPDAVISQQIEFHRLQASKLLDEVKALTARLGVSPTTAIGTAGAGESKSGNALMVVSGQSNVKDYQNSLVLAKEKQLPELFESIKKANGEVERWMMAGTLPMQAVSDGLKGTLEEIGDRIFNTSLYAGLTEEVVQCRDGEPAGYADKVRVMQRMLYMDEECLLGYRHGGMDFRDISKFDEWISEDANRDRLLPFSRCVVAMRVRRTKKERDWDGSLRSLFINIQLGESDKYTFLYLRNGDQVYRLSCDIDFGETLFPSREEFDPARPVMVKMFSDRVDKIMSRDEYDALVTEKRLRKKLSDKWEKEHPEAEWKKARPNENWHYANPHRERGVSFNARDWKPFDGSNVYFDEIAEHYAQRIKEHNRIALILQGLLDRSPVFHPHPPAKLWSPDGFAAALELVYDATSVIHWGETPDFDAYLQRCNESLGPDSIVVGQELFWMEKEAEKECRRLDADGRNRSEFRPKVFTPHGNPGPGYLARMAQWKPRARIATFTWHRERQTSNWATGESYGDPLPTSVSVPADRLFNISAYKLGDYLQFFRDSRTRQAYLKWAPVLLAAEEYHAGGKIDVQMPI